MFYINSGADLSRDNVAKLANEVEIAIGGWDSPAYTDEHWDILAEVIRTATSLETLVLFASTVTALQSDKVIDALAKNRTIKTLESWASYGGDKGVKAIAAILKENSTIEEVKLHNVSGEGAKAIADALKHNKTLQRINLSNNQIRIRGATAIAAVLKENVSLRELCIGSSSIGKKGAKVIAEALKENKSLQKLFLIDNKIGVEGAKAIAASLKENHSLRELHIKRANIGDEGAKDIAEALKENTSLQKLNLKDNNIGEEGVKHILNALQQIERSAIKKIDLDYHDKVSDGTQAKIEQEMIRIEALSTIQEIAELHDELALKEDEIASLRQRLNGIDEDLENYTKCCVCLEPYEEGPTSTDNQRLPIKSATCAHSLCEGCLDAFHASLMNGRSALRYVRCPQCNDKTKKAFDIQNKVVDFFLREYIQCRKRKRSA